MNKHVFLSAWMFLTAVAFCQAPPTILHTPVPTAPPGQAIPVTVTVDGHGQSLSEVNMHVALAENEAPIKIPMIARGAGAYMGTIPQEYNNRVSSIRYYIEAKTAVDFAETDWHGINIQAMSVVQPVTPPEGYTNPQAANPPPERVGPTVQPSKKKDRSWVYPAVIIGAGAAIVGGVVAVSGSGGGSSNNNTPAAEPEPEPTTTTPTTTTPSTTAQDPVTTPTTTTTTTPGVFSNATPTTTVEDPLSTREVITQAANDTVRSAVVNLPVQTVIDPTARIAGRTLITTSINLNYDPVDGFADRFVVLFDGALVLDTGPVTAAGNLNVVVPNGVGVVTISVPFSLADRTNIFNWSWAAAIAYSVE